MSHAEAGGHMKPNVSIDISEYFCPMTFVKTKVALAEMKMGEILEILLRGKEPFCNIPRSAKDEGHEILLAESLGKDRFRILLRKNQSGKRSVFSSASKPLTSTPPPQGQS